jgi:hypothetical protein
VPGADGTSQYVHRGDQREQARPGVHGEHYGPAPQRHCGSPRCCAVALRITFLSR